MKTILVTGNPVDGFQFVGPFEDSDDAVRYAEDEEHRDTEWWLGDLESPEERAEPAPQEDEEKDDAAGV